MTKDDKVFYISGLEVKEGSFISDSLNSSYVLNVETGGVSLTDKKYIFTDKESAQDYLIQILKDKIKNITLWEERMKESLLVIDKIQKISDDFDLKKKEVKNG